MSRAKPRNHRGYNVWSWDGSKGWFRFWTDRNAKSGFHALGGSLAFSFPNRGSASRSRQPFPFPRQATRQVICFARFPSRARHGGMKVLIVDDHPIVHAGLRRLIAAETDAEIAEAATAKEALARFTETARISSSWISICQARRRSGNDPAHDMTEHICPHPRLQRARRLNLRRARFRGRGARLCDEERAARPDFARHLPRRRGSNYIEPEIAQELALLTRQDYLAGAPLAHPSRI